MLMLAIATVGAWAQSAPRLVVWQKSGEKVFFDLNEMPETTFEDGKLEVTYLANTEDGKLVITTTKSTAYYQLENIVRYTYEGVTATDIALQTNERAVQVSRDGNAVTFRNLKEGATIAVYTANGLLLEQRKAESGKSITLSVEDRPSGVYLIKTEAETIKLMKP